jgi:hypothetical protein
MPDLSFLLVGTAWAQTMAAASLMDSGPYTADPKYWKYVPLVMISLMVYYLLVKKKK